MEFKIESFTRITGINIKVFVTHENVGLTVTIPEDKYNIWLRTTGKLDWCMDYADHQGEHVQKEGVMTIDEYWNTTHVEIIQYELYEYISTHPIKYKTEVRQDAVESILSAIKSLSHE